jgi:TolB-like protein
MKFWQELRRRRVYRLAGLYIVGAWLIIQVADISFPAWGVPETALRYLFIAAAACFPVALIFSWYYDVTSKGIVRTEAADGSELADLKLTRADYLVLTALLAVGLAILLGSANKIQEEIELGPTMVLEAGWRENSIAVLPFTNLDINPDTGYFSDGITEEILYRLSSLGALHVLASNSSFGFRDSKESLAQIRDKLGVRYLLQGSIRRENDYVRVTARLVDEGGFQIWSESFERKLEGIFAIQTEIASTVASHIINEIVPLQELPAGRTTTNMEAYNEYLVGKAYLDARTADWREQAIAAYRKAIELDPGFAPPYAGLAMAITVNIPWGPNWEEGRQLADKALELDPDLAEAHYALGTVLVAEGRLYQGALSSRRALKLDPSLGFAYNTLAAALERMRRVDEANAVMQKGLAVDPLNPPLVANVAARESRAGNFDRAEQLFRRLINLPEPPSLAYGTLNRLYEDWGRYADAVRIAKEQARMLGEFEQLVFGYANLGMTEDADYWKNITLGRLSNDWMTLRLKYRLLSTRGIDTELATELQHLISENDSDNGDMHPFNKYFLALINIQLGNYEKGIEQMKSAIGVDISALKRRFDTGDVIFSMHRLAFAYQQVGRSRDALKLLHDLQDEIPLGSTESAFLDPVGLESVALHRALMGDKAGALQKLQQAADIGWANYYDVVNDPAWAEAIKAPEFQKLLGEVKDEIDRQRVIVEGADAQHDFRVEVEQLLSN